MIDGGNHHVSHAWRKKKVLSSSIETPFIKRNRNDFEIVAERLPQHRSQAV